MNLNLIFEYYGRGYGSYRTIQNEVKSLRESSIKVNKNSLRPLDVNHAHTMGPLSLLHLHGSKPLVYTNHISSYESQILKIPGIIVEKFSEYFKKKSDVVVSPSPFGKKLMEKNLDKPIAVISNGIDTEKFRFSQRRRERFRKRFGLEDKKVIYSVGTPIPKKGLSEMIKLADHFKDEDDVQLMWVGRIFPHLEVDFTLNDLRKKYENILFTGFVEDIVAAHSAGDVFLMPSHHELFGIPVIEAMACDRPVIVRDIECYRDWLHDGKNCLKFDGDLIEVVEGVLEGDSEKLVKGGRETVKNHDLESLREAYTKLYTGVRNREFEEARQVNSFK